jgi:GTP-binding protein HflX
MVEKRSQIEGRRRLGYPSVCIAGYYNAGKTSLFNALTGERKPVSNRPFTTLSSKYQKRYIDQETTVLFVDTIGFVLDLDHRLIKSFQLNFEDIRSADVVILLFDLTDDPLALKIKMIEGIGLLREIGVSLSRVIFVYNKVDKVPERAFVIEEELGLRNYDIPWITASAEKKINLNELLALLSRKIKELRVNPPTEPKPMEIKPPQEDVDVEGATEVEDDPEEES